VSDVRPRLVVTTGRKPQPTLVQPEAHRTAAEAVLLATLGAVARLPVGDVDLQPMLTAFAELAVRGIGPALGASVVLGGSAEPTLLVSTDRIAQTLDGAQHRAGQGPAWDAYGTGASVTTAELSTDARWPVLGPLVPAGTHAVTAVPLAFRAGQPGGVLMLFGTPELAEPEQVWRAEAFAAAGSTLLREHASIGDLRRQLQQLHDALDARAVIEQAKGVLMGRYGLDPESAFAELSRRSQSTNVKVREVARRLVAEAGRTLPDEFRDEDDALPDDPGSEPDPLEPHP
jgi:ANTAR domain